MGALGSVVRASETATLAYAEDVWIRFDAAAETTVLAVATLALVVIGYLLLTGQLSLQAGQFFPRLFRWVVLLALLLNMPLLFPWAYALVTDVPNRIAVFLLGSGPIANETAVIDLIERVMSAGFAAASRIWTDSNVLDLTSHVVSGLLMLTGLALAIVAAVLLMVSKLGVGILLAVAPFFLTLRLLDIGRGLFEGWLRQLLTFALVPVFVYSLIALNFVILERSHVQLTDAISAGDFALTAAAPYLLVASTNLILLTQVMGWAGGVGGGIALAVSAGGVMGGVATAARLGMAGGRTATSAAVAGGRVAVPAAISAGRNVMRNLGRGF